MRYFEGSKFFGSLVHKKNFWFAITSNQNTCFFKGGRITLLNLKELAEKSQTTIFFSKFGKSRSAYIFREMFSIG